MLRQMYHILCKCTVLLFHQSSPSRLLRSRENFKIVRAGCSMCSNGRNTTINTKESTSSLSQDSLFVSTLPSGAGCDVIRRGAVKAGVKQPR